MTLATIIYFMSTYGYYNDQIRDSKYFFLAGIVLAVINNVLWLYLTRILKEPNTLMFFAFIWDMIILATAIIVPTVFFGVKPTLLGWIGIGLVITGITLFKLGMSNA